MRRLVGIDSLWIAGSHGFDIAAPPGMTGGKRVASEIEPEVHRAAGELRRKTASIPGVIVEDKLLSIGVPYRLVDEASVPLVERAVDDVLREHPALLKSYGKKVFQMEPARDWHKGKALRWLLEATDQPDAFPIYLGDDLTDEDAFEVLAKRGVSVVNASWTRAGASRRSRARRRARKGSLKESARTRAAP